MFQRTVLTITGLLPLPKTKSYLIFEIIAKLLLLLSIFYAVYVLWSHESTVERNVHLHRLVHGYATGLQNIFLTTGVLIQTLFQFSGTWKSDRYIKKFNAIIFEIENLRKPRLNLKSKLHTQIISMILICAISVLSVSFWEIFLLLHHFPQMLLICNIFLRYYSSAGVFKFWIFTHVHHQLISEMNTIMEFQLLGPAKFHDLAYLSEMPVFLVSSSFTKFSMLDQILNLQHRLYEEYKMFDFRFGIIILNAVASQTLEIIHMTYFIFKLYIEESFALQYSVCVMKVLISSVIVVYYSVRQVNERHRTAQLLHRIRNRYPELRELVRLIVQSMHEKKGRNQEILPNSTD